MWALWVLGRQLEAALGPLRFAALYLIAGLGGNVAAYLFSARERRRAGASTAIFGLFAALFIIMRRLGRDTSGDHPDPGDQPGLHLHRPGHLVAGHLGGLVIGGLVAVSWRTRRGPTGTSSRRSAAGWCWWSLLGLTLSTDGRADQRERADRPASALGHLVRAGRRGPSG